MNINKCKTCVFYDSFFNSCILHSDEVYLGEGDFDVVPVNIKNVSKLECGYAKKAGA